MASLLDGSFAAAPSEPADTSSPPLPSPPFDVGGFLSGLSSSVFGTNPQQVGQSFSNIGSGVQSNLSSFQQRGVLGSNLGESLFPHAYEGLQEAASPFEVGGAFGGTPDFPSLGKSLNSTLQGIAGATDTTTNPTAKNIADYGVGLPQALSVVHGGATYGQGAGNLLQQIPDLDTKLSTAFKQGFKGLVDSNSPSTGPLGLSNPDEDAALKTLMDESGQATNTLFDKALMNQALFNSFKSFGADDGLAKYGADSFAGFLNFGAQMVAGLPTGEAGTANAVARAAGGPVARAMMAEFFGQLMTNPGGILPQLINMSPSYDLEGEGASIHADVQKANAGQLTPEQVDSLNKRIDEFNQQIKNPSAGQPTTGDFLSLVGTVANMARGGSAPTSTQIDKGLTAIANAVPAGLMGLHGLSKGAGLAAHLSYKAADHVQALSDARAAIQSVSEASATKPAETSPILDYLHDQKVDALRNLYAPENIQQAVEASATNETSQTNQAINAGQASSTEAASGTNQNLQSTNLAAALETNPRLQGENLPESNSKPVSPPVTFTGEHSEGVPDQTKNAIQSALGDINSSGWVNEIRLMEHGTGIDNFGSWNPEDNPHAINLDMKNLGQLQIHNLLFSLRSGLQKVAEDSRGDPSRTAAINDANRAIDLTEKSLNPNTLMMWIAAHEALHSNLSRIYDYPPKGEQLDSVKTLAASHIAEGLQLIRHMDSTPEGKAWLDHLATQMEMEGEVGQLRLFSRSSGNLPLEDVVADLNKIPDVVQKNISDAKEAVNEALVHAILNGKDLSPYPYYTASGERAYEKSFWSPEITAENGRLATSYFDRYNASPTAEPHPIDSGAVANPSLSAVGSPADRSGDTTAANQARLTPESAQTAIDTLNAQRAARATPNKDIGPGTKLIQRDADPKANVATVERVYTSTTGKELASIRLPNGDTLTKDLVSLRKDLAEPGSAWSRIESRAPKSVDDLSPEEKDQFGLKVINELAGLQQRIKEAQAAGDTDTVLKLQLESYAKASVYSKMMETPPKPDDFVVGSSPKPIDYESEALRLTNIRPENALSPLKDLAGKVGASLNNFNRAREAGMGPQDLEPLQRTLQFQMARFRSAYDLYNSPVFKNNLDKQSYAWKGTRGISKRVAAEKNLTPRDQAQLAVKLLSEQTKKPYTLQQAGQAIRDTALGVSKEAKNWHPDFRQLLAGEMWHTVKQVYDNDPRLPLGVKNIPTHELLQVEDLQDLHNSLKDLEATRSAQRAREKTEIAQADIMARRGKLPPEAVAKMERDRRQRDLDFSNRQALLNALIDNHPQNAHSALVNAPLLKETDLNDKPSVESALQKYGVNPLGDLPNTYLVDRANALNDKIGTPSPDGFSFESFMNEGHVPDSGEPDPHPLGGQSWFSPNWAEALTNLRELGGNHKLLADLTQDLLEKMGEHLDPSRNLWHPKQWFKAHWEAIAGIPNRVGQIKSVMNELAKDDPNFSKSILQAIDDQNDVAQRQASGLLTKEQAAIANFLNEYWRTTRTLFQDPDLGETPLVAHFVENYVPHVVLKDPNGNIVYDPKRAAWSSKANAAKKRVEDGVAHEPIYRTLLDLERQGYTVQWNLADVFGGHANSTFKMMKLREMTNTLGGLIYRSPDGSFSGHPIISNDDLATLKTRLQRQDSLSPDDQKTLDSLSVFEDSKAKVRWGPGDTMFQAYRVHPELAREIEKLANMKDMPGSGFARALNAMGGLFKFVEFSINPRHAFNIFSNIANLHSPAGLLDPTVWRNIYGRANRALLPDQQGAFFRNVSSRGNAAHVQQLLNEKAGLEKQMHDLQTRMEAINDDPLDAIPWSLTPESAALRDTFSSTREELLARHRELDQALGIRDRRLLSNLMDKGLTPDRELMETDDINAIHNWSEKIPGIKQFHRWMWRDVVWRGQIGTAMHLTDQFLQKAAKDPQFTNGITWDGKGGAARAETFLSPEMQDRIHREAVFYSKQATALLNKLDMTAGWQLYGRASLLSAPWTLGQLQATRDVLGANFNNLLRSNKYTRAAAGEDFTHVSQAMVDAGFGKTENQFLDSMHTQLARRMLLSGMAKLAMTSFFMQAIPTLLYTGQIGNPITNFMRDPGHTFDIYTGKDPATGADHWIDNPLFGFQREMANYTLAGVKAGMEGKPWYTVAMAPLDKFSGKANPMLRMPIDLAFGIETSRWVAGFEPGMDKDTDLQLLHRTLTSMGVPDWGGMEDRILYAIRNLPRPPGVGTGTFPAMAIKRNADLSPVLDNENQEIPLTDPRSLLSDFGFGGLASAGADIATGNPMQAVGDIVNTNFGLSSIGVTQVDSSRPLYDWSPTNPLSIQKNQEPTGFFPAQAKAELGQRIQAKNQEAQSALVQIGNLAASNDPNTFAQLTAVRDQYGLTDRQVVDAVMYGAAANINGRYTKGKGLGATGLQGGSLVTLNGDQLTEAQSVEYNKNLNNNQIYAMLQLKNDPEFQTADGPTKAMLLKEFSNIGAKFTSTQAGQLYQGTGGEKLTGDQFKTLIESSLATRTVVQGAISQLPEYQNASAGEKIKMYQNYLTMANTLTWDRQYGKLKNLSDSDLQTLVGNSVTTEAKAIDYLHNTPFYQQAIPDEQMAMEKNYSALSRQMNINLYNGTTKNVMPFALPTYMQSVINTEETSRYLLHQSDFYQMADLKTQQSLDSKYQTISRNMATKDWSNGTPLVNLGQVDKSFTAGPEQIIVGHLMAEQGYTDLQNKFGGPQTLTSYAQQETQIRNQIRSTTVAPPAAITRMVNISVAAYERANPQYAAFKKARTNWEKSSSVGRLYASLNANDTALATVNTSTLADPTTVTNTLDLALPDTVQSTPEEQAVGLA